MATTRSTSCPANSQAVLLRGRGDLKGGRSQFNVDLPKASPIARSIKEGSSISRLGMDVQRSGSMKRLVVAEIDAHPRHRTPVAQWNREEEKQSDRGENEQHASLAVKAGDRIKAVVDFGGDDLSRAVHEFNTMSQTAMLAQLEEASKPESPRNLSLMVSRDIEDVMAPARVRPRIASAATPPKLPRRPSNITSVNQPMSVIDGEMHWTEHSSKLRVRSHPSRNSKERRGSLAYSVASTRTSTPTQERRELLDGLSSRPSSRGSSRVSSRRSLPMEEVAAKPGQRCIPVGALSNAGRCAMSI